MCVCAITLTTINCVMLAADVAVAVERERVRAWWEELETCVCGGEREESKRSDSFALLVLFFFFFLPALVVSAGCCCCGIVVAVVVGAPKPNSPCGGNGDSHHTIQ